MKLQFAKRRRNECEYVASTYGGVIIPNWFWGAIKRDAEVECKSEHWVIKQALRKYLSGKGYTAEQFAKKREDEEEGEE